MVEARATYHAALDAYARTEAAYCVAVVRHHVAYTHAVATRDYTAYGAAWTALGHAHAAYDIAGTTLLAAEAALTAAIPRPAAL